MYLIIDIINRYVVFVPKVTSVTFIFLKSTDFNMLVVTKINEI